MRRETRIDEARPEATAFYTVYNRKLLIKGFLNGLNQTKVIHRHTDEHNARNINPVYHAVATLIEVVIEI